MKSEWRILVIVSVILWGVSAATFADDTSAQKTKSHSQTSSVNNRLVQKEPIITSEAEYAEFVRRREGVGSAHSSSSVGLASSYSNKSKNSPR